jgi:5-methylcytosine-specific restriction endonuclease McrA
MLNMGYEPLNIISWKKAIRLLYLDKAEAVERYDVFIHSPSIKIPMPAVIRLMVYINPRHNELVYSKWNMYVRDQFVCQYCAKTCDPCELTKDHVVPRTKGGVNSWENCVTCCYGCNNKKGGRTPKEARMQLIRAPKRPRENRLIYSLKKKKMRVPTVWEPYMPVGKPQ